MGDTLYQLKARRTSNTFLQFYIKRVCIHFYQRQRAVGLLEKRVSSNPYIHMTQQSHKSCEWNWWRQHRAGAGQCSDLTHCGWSCEDTVITAFTSEHLRPGNSEDKAEQAAGCRGKTWLPGSFQHRFCKT